jgi:hypothetical protein
MLPATKRAPWRVAADRHGQPRIASCSQTRVINESLMMITANSRLAASTREFFFIF